MNAVPLLVAAMAVLPVFTLVAWVWLVTASATDELSSSAGFEGLHFEE